MPSKDAVNYSVALPLCRARPHPDDAFLISDVVGSCFALGENFMLTAGHVLDEIKGEGVVGTVVLAHPSIPLPKGARIVASETLPCDIGIIAVDFTYPPSATWSPSMYWHRPSLRALQQVTSLGYPYGFHNVDEKRSIVQRAFQGHIVAPLNEFKPLGYSGKPFSAYELSFSAPRGLSGAPLMIDIDGFLSTGVVIGNSRSSMLVLDTEEIESDSKSKTIMQHYESLSLGIAVPSAEILPLVSKILGTTVEEYLRRHGRIRD